MASPVPVALFAYARPQHLLRALDGLWTNRVPLIYAFSDGARTAEKEPDVEMVRAILRQVNWCELILHERSENLGIGRSILTGVSSVLEEHDSVIVVEDDLVCLPGFYPYMVEGLHRYRETGRVMSVTGWTHPRVTPRSAGGQPYFDGRAECWSWGTWRRVWRGMDRTAQELIQECLAHGIDIYRYGADLPDMARVELERNIWAVRFLYLHILNGGLCLRPRRTMVRNIGFDSLAENTRENRDWPDPEIQDSAASAIAWPVPAENPECSCLWRRMYPRDSSITLIARALKRLLRRVARRARSSWWLRAREAGHRTGPW